MPKFNFKKTLKEGAKELGIELSDEQLGLFLKYKELIQEISERINLTNLVSDEEIVVKHFLDSLSIVKVSGLPSGKWIDIGTGAGLPLIPIKIAFPEIQITLLDSKSKAVRFVEDVCKKLGLRNFETVWIRAEDAVKDDKYFEKFDVVVARAVASLEKLCELALPFVKIEGKFYAYKGRLSFEEIEEAKNNISRLGGIIEQVEKITVPFLDAERHMAVVLKQANTIRGDRF